MGALLNFDNTDRTIVGVDPDQYDTPEEAVDNGDKEAIAAFMDYVRSEFMKWELEDFIRSHDGGGTVRAWMQAWSKKVQRGEL